MTREEWEAAKAEAAWDSPMQFQSFWNGKIQTRYSYDGDYSTLVESFCQEIIHSQDMGSYQGDTAMLVIGNDGRIGWVHFGWGSCSGCDWLEGASTIEEIVEIRNALFNEAKWFDTTEEALEFWRSRKWEDDYKWRDEEFRGWKLRCQEWLEANVS